MTGIGKMTTLKKKTTIGLSTTLSVYPQKNHNGKRQQGKKAMGIKTTVYSETE